MMSDPFLIALRETLQASVLLALVLFSPPARDEAPARLSLLAGFFLAVLLGLLAGAVPSLTRSLGPHEIWAFWRSLSEAVLFSGSIVLLIRRISPPRRLVHAAMFFLGFLLVFFESRTLGFIVHDMGVVASRTAASFGSAACGLALGAL